MTVSVRTACLWALVTGVVGAVGLALLEAQPTGAAFYPVYEKVNITSNTTTSPLTSSGVLHAVCINNAGASSNTASVYDDPDSADTVVAVIDTVELNGRCLVYDMALDNGLTIVTATGTAADLTVLYRDLR